MSRDSDITSYYPLAKRVARSMARSSRVGFWTPAADELESDAMLALVLAYDNFDADKGRSLGSWLKMAVPREMASLFLRRLGQETSARRRHLTSLISLDFLEEWAEEVGASVELPTVSDDLSGALHDRHLVALVDDLIERIYGRDYPDRAWLLKCCVLDGMSVIDAGRMIGLTKANASQHFMIAKARLGRELIRVGVYAEIA